MEKNYFDKIDEDNIIDSMNSRDKIFKKYDNDTEQLLFFITNSIQSIKKKIQKIDTYLKIDKTRKFSEINKKSHDFIKDIKLEKIKLN